MRINNLLFICFFLMSCQTEKATREIKIVDKVPSNFQMYKTSEMADLMRLMYANNMIIRQQIIEKEEIEDFNEEYLRIHTAKLTDTSDLDETFNSFAAFFIKNQKEIHTTSKNNRKNKFNRMVQACIACHKDRCTGPIPKIRKLIIP